MKIEITPEGSGCPIFLLPANLEQVAADIAETKTRKDAQTAKDAARQAVLDKLGLSADEAQALLG